MQAIAPVVRAMCQTHRYQMVVLAHPMTRNIYERLGIRAHELENQSSELLRERLREKLEHFRPDLIVTGTSRAFPEEPVTPEQHMHSLAKEYHIPGLCILDCWGGYVERFGKDGKNLNKEFIPDIICALDKSCREELVNLGIGPERIAITHNPRYDNIVAEIKKNESFISPDIRPSELNILFVSQPLSENNRLPLLGYDQEKLFFDFLYGIGGWRTSQPKHILVWIHPKENPSRWTQILADTIISYSVTIGRDRGPSVLRHVDLLVSAYSTVLFEALYYNIPCFSLQTGLKVEDPLVTNMLKLSIPIYSLTELRRTLESFDLQRWRTELFKRRKNLERRGIFFSDGQATTRVLNIIEKILECDRSLFS